MSEFRIEKREDGWRAYLPGGRVEEPRPGFVLMLRFLPNGSWGIWWTTDGAEAQRDNPQESL